MAFFQSPRLMPLLDEKSGKDVWSKFILMLMRRGVITLGNRIAQGCSSTPFVGRDKGFMAVMSNDRNVLEPVR